MRSVRQFSKVAPGPLAKAELAQQVASMIKSGGGRSLKDQQTEIEKLRGTNTAAYDDPGTQSALDRLIELRHAIGEIDDRGNEVVRRRRRGLDEE